MKKSLIVLTNHAMNTAKSFTANDYHKSLMYLSYSVIRTDGLVNNDESTALKRLLELEKIGPDDNRSFLEEVKDLDSNQIFNSGLKALKNCSLEEQGRILGWIYNLVEVDEVVDVREARFLLYAINASNHNIEDIIEISKELPVLS